MFCTCCTSLKQVKTTFLINIIVFFYNSIATKNITKSVKVKTIVEEVVDGKVVSSTTT